MFGVLLVKYFPRNITSKKTRFKGKKKVLVRAAISYTGLRCLYSIEGNENIDVY
jgi:hypothetical protein